MCFALSSVEGEIRSDLTPTTWAEKSWTNKQKLKQAFSREKNRWLRHKQNCVSTINKFAQELMTILCYLNTWKLQCHFCSDLLYHSEVCVSISFGSYFRALLIAHKHTKKVIQLLSERTWNFWWTQLQKEKVKWTVTLLPKNNYIYNSLLILYHNSNKNSSLTNNRLNAVVAYWCCFWHQRMGQQMNWYRMKGVWVESHQLCLCPTVSTHEANCDKLRFVVIFAFVRSHLFKSSSSSCTFIHIHAEF